MHWVTIIIVGLAANLDNLGISISYGIRKIKIPLLSNLIICLISMLATYMSVIMGDLLTHFVPLYLANLLGSLLLCAIGTWALLFHKQSRLSLMDHSEQADWDQNQVISWKEACYLGAALSLNCIASGIGVGANQISPVWTMVSVGVFSLLTIECGQHLGYQLAKTVLGRYSAVIGGLMLIIIGVIEFFY